MTSNLTVKVGADIQGLQKELNKATGQLNTFGKGMNKIGGMIAGAFAVGQLANFGQEVFNVTAEFQKFEAVLTNTLGHKGAAQAALAQITDFAAKTPYQVNELTASFVKLANQGFVPTVKEMTSLGDLASAMGKSFDQLTEAIIDAQTGEFERLKEFGIRAEKQGDKVTFTFKGVKQQVDFTADSIRNYVLSLGDVEGVAGGMAAQSETLGGGLSNLKDAFEQLQLAIGRSAESGGIFSKTLDLIAASVKGLTAAFNVGESKEELVKTIQFFKEARSLAAREGDMDSWTRANDAMQAATEKLRNLVEGERKLAEIQEKKTIPVIEAYTVRVNNLKKAFDSLSNKKEVGTKEDAGGNFLLDLGVFAEQANQISAVMAGLNNTLKVNSNEWDIWAAGVQARTQQVAEEIVIDFAPMIHSALSGIGHALGDAVSGSQNFGDALLGVLGGVLVQLGEMILAAGIATESFKVSLKSLNGIPAIVTGMSLIAIGSAVSNGIKGLGSSAGSSHRSAVGSGGGSGRSNVGSLGSGGMEIKLGGEWRIQGADLVYIFNRQQQLNGRTHG